MAKTFTTRSIPPAEQILRDAAIREEGAQAAIMQLLRTACVLDYGEPYIPASAALKLLKGKLTMFEVKCGAV